MPTNTSSSNTSSQWLNPNRASPSKRVRIEIKNRRKRYLDTHPSYFLSPSLELA
ncbi:hypothetical protein MMC07_002549, partial [Pseudocyphellaria aurata]|nr:hypothetical protein [Pseudocyphellaria aurata]